MTLDEHNAIMSDKNPQAPASTAPYAEDLERGLRNRRATLGDAWVDRSLANATGFNADFQNYITRYAWHEVWGRPGLAPKTRRIIVLASTAALSRWEEYELHARAALTDKSEHGLSIDELRELLIQIAVYSGVPAANTGVAIIGKLLKELGIDPGPGDVLGAAHSGVGRSGYTADAPRIRYFVREAHGGGGFAREAREGTRGTIVLSHALGCDASMWDTLANELAADYRVVTYDHRGHGGSDAPAGAYTLAELADDARRVVAATAPDGVIWIGVSMGGIVGQELALREPRRVRALVIANSSGGYPPEARAQWQQRIETVQRGGMAAIADMVLGRYFAPAFHQQQPATVARFRRRLLATDATGYVGCCHALRDLDTLPRLKDVRVPTLVIAGELDQGTPVAMSQALVAAIRGSRLHVLRDASHISVIEQPATFARAVQDFLDDLPSDFEEPS